MKHDNVHVFSVKSWPVTDTLSRYFILLTESHSRISTTDAWAASVALEASRKGLLVNVETRSGGRFGEQLQSIELASVAAQESPR